MPLADLRTQRAVKPIFTHLWPFFRSFTQQSAMGGQGLGVFGPVGGCSAACRGATLRPSVLTSLHAWHSAAQAASCPSQQFGGCPSPSGSARDQSAGCAVLHGSRRGIATSAAAAVAQTPARLEGYDASQIQAHCWGLRVVPHCKPAKERCPFEVTGGSCCHQRWVIVWALIGCSAAKVASAGGSGVSFKARAGHKQRAAMVERQ